MQHVLERAVASLDAQQRAKVYGCDMPYPDKLMGELIAEVRRWRELAERATGEETADSLDEFITLSGLSIHLGEFGEWGSETLAHLFAELGIQPGDDLESALEHARAAKAGNLT